MSNMQAVNLISGISNPTNPPVGVQAHHDGSGYTTVLPTIGSESNQSLSMRAKCRSEDEGYPFDKDLQAGTTGKQTCFEERFNIENNSNNHHPSIHSKKSNESESASKAVKHGEEPAMNSAGHRENSVEDVAGAVCEEQV